MPSGKLGNATLTGGNNATLYTVPANTITTANVSMCNRGPGDAVVRLAVSATANPSNAEFLEYDVTIPVNGTLERTGIVCGPGENIVVRSSSSNVSARAHGFEEAA